MGEDRICPAIPSGEVTGRGVTLFGDKENVYRCSIEGRGTSIIRFDEGRGGPYFGLWGGMDINEGSECNCACSNRSLDV